MNEVGVLLTPRDLGGHESALLGWLVDAVRDFGLRPHIVAPGPALAQACAVAGLPASGCSGSRLQLLQALRDWPSGRPLLLAPGVLHADAWLLAAAVALRRRVWVYVPMAHSAVAMHYRAARWRDGLLAPCLRQVEAWITLDLRQAGLLQQVWGIAAPVHLLPNRARLPQGPPVPSPPATDGRLRVAYVGRFEAWQKGLDWLIDTLRGDPLWTTQFHWRFQGRGPAGLALQELASSLGPQHVQVRDHAPIDDALAVSDVLLLASRYEGLPLVALEATARGWPVVATRDSGVEGLLPAQALFDFGDAAGLQLALARLRTPAQRAAAVATARERMQRLCDPQVYGACLHAVVQALRGEPGPAC